MNKYLFLLFFLHFSPYDLFSNPTITELDGIRGYKFGETRPYVLQKEQNKKEYTLNISQTNQIQLIYMGVLFNKKVSVFYRFSEGRLISLSYLWQNEKGDQLFHQYLLDLLEIKYNTPTIKTIPSLHSIVEINSYTKYIDENKIPILSINLEKISLSNILDNTVQENYILEYRPFDADTTIQNHILSEDL